MEAQGRHGRPAERIDARAVLLENGKDLEGRPAAAFRAGR
jgi:hypothetical protein